MVQKFPPPKEEYDDGKLRALIYDCWFDSYLGVVIQVRVLSGTMKPGEKVKLFATGAECEVYKLGVFAPFALEIPSLSSGEVGYFSAAIKNLRDVKICLLYTSPSPRDATLSRMPSSA